MVGSLSTGVASGVPERTAGGGGQVGRHRGRNLLRAHHAQETNRYTILKFKRAMNTEQYTFASILQGNKCFFSLPFFYLKCRLSKK